MNKFKNYYHYSIFIGGRKEERKIAKLEKENEREEMKKIRNFEKPVTENKLYKIYIVKDKFNIIYIGVTSQGMTTRLRYGLNPKGANGYHGYKWKHLNQVGLFIFCFDRFKTKSERKIIEEKMETIEAEIVYLIRNKTGNWPKYQTEIHFHNLTENEKKAARSIYEAIKNKYK